MKKRHPRRKETWLWAICLSLTLHVPLLYLASQSFTEPLSPDSRSRSTLRATLVPQEQPKPIPPKPPEEQPEGVVVELPEPDKEVPPPEKTENLAQKNQKVEKEQKARTRKRRKNKPRRGRTVPKESRLQSAESESIQPTKLEKKQEAEAAATVRRPATSDVGEKSSDKEVRLPAHPSLLLPATHSQLAVANLQAQSARSATDDALLHIDKEGDETFLNAKEFRYWQFFQRVKEKVRENWRPGNEYRRRDPTGRLLGVKDRYTLLQATLGKDGNLERLAVVRKSGAVFLDEEAIRAFRNASPFPNPPRGLVGEDGRITFEFGFLFEITSGPQFFWKR